MHLTNKINAVNRLLKEANKHVSAFQSKSGISCLANCGLCCTKHDIEATILEFLPAAYQLCVSGEFLSLFESIDKKEDTNCIFYTPFSNGKFCSHYENRGLICRLFGFSTKKDKHGALTLATCKPIKQTHDLFLLGNKLRFAPEMSDYYMKLFGIDPNLSIKYIPINQAIKKAIEIVSLHLDYKKNTA